MSLGWVAVRTATYFYTGLLSACKRYNDLEEVVE